MILQKTSPGAREQIQAMTGCQRLGIPCRFSSTVGPREETHVGSVEWCQEALGFAPIANFYPFFLYEWFQRWLRYNLEEYTAEQRLFGKPANGYKVAPARIFEPGETVPPMYACSEIVTFTQEWRYYVAEGELLAAGWYDGTDESEPAPKLDIEWPKGWCGAVDFGRLDTGEIALVESHHPFACGNYLESDECELWAMWLEVGWQWTLKGN